MNHKLITQLKQLVQTERKITAEIVELIKEIDRLKLYLNHGHNSMFSFLTKEMGYTPASAIRRINAARVLKEIPELKESLKSGSINLSQASMVAEAVRQKEKSQRNQNTEPFLKISKEVKQDLLQQVQSLDLIATEKVIAQSLDLEIKSHEKTQFQKDGSIRLEVTLNKEQWDDLQRVKELVSHQNTDPSVSDLKRDQGCQWITQTPNQKGQIVHKKCNSKFQLQIDHIRSRWMNGTNESNNLQLLCSVHNKLKYRNEMSAL